MSEHRGLGGSFSEAPKSCSERWTLSRDGVNVGEGAASSRISGEAAAGLEDLAVHDSGASLCVGQSRNLGLTPFFFSMHVASPGAQASRTQPASSCPPLRGLLYVATPVASDLILVELSGGQPASIWPVKASLSWLLSPFDQSITV